MNRRFRGPDLIAFCAGRVTGAFAARHKTLAPPYELVCLAAERSVEVQDAKADAAAVASELAGDDDWDGYSVMVNDEHGNEIARTPIEG
jgi:hypothetical protein